MSTSIIVSIDLGSIEWLKKNWWSVESACQVTSGSSVKFAIFTHNCWMFGETAVRQWLLNRKACCWVEAQEQFLNSCVWVRRENKSFNSCKHKTLWFSAPIQQRSILIKYTLHETRIHGCRQNTLLQVRGDGQSFEQISDVYVLLVQWELAQIINLAL